MPRPFTGDTLVIATHNPGKAREIAALLGDYVKHFPLAGDLGLPEPEETGATFADNAALKALASAKGANLPALADDSGLCVTALGGEPGIYSARWAGAAKDFDFAMRTVHDRLEGAPDRSASFHSTLAIAWPDGHVEIFEGTIGGQLVWPPRGNRGFGYDPMFVPGGYDITFGEMDPKEKYRISHRTKAFERLVKGCFLR